MPIIVTLTDSATDALTLIKRAMRLIGVLTPGKSPSTDEIADGLEALNAMLDSWRLDRLNTYAFQEEALNLSAGVQSYTIGSGGTVNTVRPVAIESCYASYNGTTYPMQVFDEHRWADIQNRALSGDVPEALYYSPQSPLGTLYVAPVPTLAAVVYMVTRVVLGKFATSASTAYLPPGYTEAIETNLAIEIAPEFEKSASQELVLRARNSKAAIRRANAREWYLKNDAADLASSRPSFNVLTGR